MRFKPFLQDFLDGARRIDLWPRLGFIDFMTQYKGTYFGALWHLMLITIRLGSITLVYSQVFGISPRRYLPFLGFGILTWQLISGMIAKSTVVVSKYSNYLRQLRVPLSIFILKGIAQETMQFLMSASLLLLILFLTGSEVAWGMVGYSLLGVVLLVAEGTMLPYLLSLLTVRIKDLQPLVGSIMNIAFLLSPVLWRQEMVGARRWYLLLNPFYHLLQIVREPLVDGQVSIVHYYVVGCILLANIVLALAIYNRYRSKLLYWSDQI